MAERQREKKREIVCDYVRVKDSKKERLCVGVCGLMCVCGHTVHSYMFIQLYKHTRYTSANSLSVSHIHTHTHIHRHAHAHTHRHAHTHTHTHT